MKPARKSRKSKRVGSRNPEGDDKVADLEAKLKAKAAELDMMKVGSFGNFLSFEIE